jgi:hypothetical protein
MNLKDKIEKALNILNSVEIDSDKMIVNDEQMKRFLGTDYVENWMQAEGVEDCNNGYYVISLKD